MDSKYINVPFYCMNETVGEHLMHSFMKIVRGYTHVYIFTGNIVLLCRFVIGN